MEMNLICGTDKILLSEFGWTTILGQDMSQTKENNHKIWKQIQNSLTRQRSFKMNKKIKDKKTQSRLGMVEAQNQLLQVEWCPPAGSPLGGPSI